MAEIREITEGEAESVATLIRLGFQDIIKRFKLSPERCPDFIGHCQTEWIQNCITKGFHYYLIEEQGNACGCIGIKMMSWLCLIQVLAVLPDFRRRGFGRQLIEYVEGEAKLRGLTRIGLDMVAKNRQLCHWYRRLGFETTQTGTRDNLPFLIRYMAKDVVQNN